jgi:hypothetical protein
MLHCADQPVSRIAVYTQAGRARPYDVFRKQVMETIDFVVACTPAGAYLPGLVFIEGATKRHYIPLFDLAGLSADALNDVAWTVGGGEITAYAIALPDEVAEGIVAPLTGLRATGVCLGLLSAAGDQEMLHAEIIRSDSTAMLGEWHPGLDASLWNCIFDWEGEELAQMRVLKQDTHSKGEH